MYSMLSLVPPSLPFRWVNLEALLHEDTLSKALSTIYKQLFLDTGAVLLPCQNACLANVPQMDGDDWDNMWEAPFIIAIC